MHFTATFGSFWDVWLVENTKIVLCYWTDVGYSAEALSPYILTMLCLYLNRLVSLQCGWCRIHNFLKAFSCMFPQPALEIWDLFYFNFLLLSYHLLGLLYFMLYSYNKSSVVLFSGLIVKFLHSRILKSDSCPFITKRFPLYCKLTLLFSVFTEDTLVNLSSSTRLYM